MPVEPEEPSALETPEEPEADALDDVPAEDSTTEESEPEAPAKEPAEAEPEPTPAASVEPPTPGSRDLLELKQQALAQLTSLAHNLDQTPEEKFRTTMMLIQSTDNQSLLPEAYAAAQAINDEKARAQALLDVINEINYFTQAKPAS
jgi:hypothetical protein